ncbi:MAG: branched-chain amino acid ABC transporter permease [Deltaproteobacteria bacterium]|nr:branched-chain amino acid ABC transporter permease [Deltaproteobacteria bacterium]
MFIQILLNGLTMSLTYILIALGFSLIFGVARIFNFAHGELYMLGGWGVVILFGRLGLNYGLSLLITMVAIGGIGIGIDRFFFKPFRGQVTAPLVVALGLQLLIAAIALIVFGEKDVSITSPFSGMTEIWTSRISNERIAVILISAVLLVAVYVFTRSTKLGLAMRAVPQNMEGALLQGVNIDRVSYIAFFIGALLAAAAGGLLAPILYVNVFQGPWAVFKAIIVVALGGIGSIGGTCAAGLIIGFTEVFSYHFFGSAVSEIAGFLLIIIILLIRPRGLFGHEA